MTDQNISVSGTQKPHKKRGLMAKLRAFKDDERGVNMVEFAFAAPFLLLLIAGSSTVMELENASTTVGKVTGTISDIISQVPSVDEFAVKSAFEAADVLLPTKSSFEAYLAGIQITNSGIPIVLWATQNRKTMTLSVPQAGDIYNRLPNDLKSQPGFVVVTRGRMSYSPHFGADFLNNKEGLANFEASNYFVPRVSIETLCNQCEQTFPEDEES